MTNDELMDQFARCEIWEDADQWDVLGMAYFDRGYLLNAAFCFRRADACRQQFISPVSMSFDCPSTTLRASAQDESVSVETEA